MSLLVCVLSEVSVCLSPVSILIDICFTPRHSESKHSQDQIFEQFHKFRSQYIHIDFNKDLIIIVFCSDNIPTIKIKSWPADSTLFDGDLMAGPYPTLFSSNMDASLTGIKGDPRKAHWDIMKISRLIFMPENIDFDEAVQIVKKPR